MKVDLVQVRPMSITTQPIKMMKVRRLHLPLSTASNTSKEEYISDLKQRLSNSWSAGLPALTLSTRPENHVLRNEVTNILNRAITILKTEPNIVSITPTFSPYADSEEKLVTVVGDTHGQFYDVLHLLDLNGEPNENHFYIFNGDFVDRGTFSFQVCILFLTYKILYPSSVFLTRGNHETIDMNILYGFFHEIIAKYDVDVMKLFWKVFDHLPLGVIINHKVDEGQSNSTSHLEENNHKKEQQFFRVLVVHGGLFSEDDVSIEYLQTLNRKELLSSNYALRVEKEAQAKNSVLPPDKATKDSKLMHEILWSDPMKKHGRAVNESRNGGLLFGPDVTESFLQQNNLDLLIRSHQVRKSGFSIEHDGKLITVFSAPNYCDAMGNKGAVINFKEGSPEPRIETFTAVKHPKVPIMAHMRYYKKSNL